MNKPKITQENFWKRFISSLILSRNPILDPEDLAKQEREAHLKKLYPNKK